MYESAGTTSTTQWRRRTSQPTRYQPVSILFNKYTPFHRWNLCFFIIMIAIHICHGFHCNKAAILHNQPSYFHRHITQKDTRIRCGCQNQLTSIFGKNIIHDDDDDDDSSSNIISTSTFQYNSLHDTTKPSDQTRRKALMASLATLTLLASPSQSSADTNTVLLEQLNIGKGQWKKETSLDSFTSLSSSSIIPATFATYATRFLLNYDESVSQWWNDLQFQYSLLSTEERRNQLGKKFGCLARSIQLGMEDYIGKDSNNSKATAKKFEDLAMLFFTSYGDSDGKDARIRQISILFTLLPKEYQPNKALRMMAKSNTSVNVDGTTSASSSSLLPVSFQEDWTSLLPIEYSILYDEKSESLGIFPSVPFFEIGIDDEFGQNAIATQFGPLSSTPLKRQISLSPAIYALFGISGGTGCALTHSVVIPFDVVKTRFQTDPDKYRGFFDGFSTIAGTEGVSALFLGAQATIVGYLWYGISVYPSYSFFKESLTNFVLPPDIATANTDGIALLAGALAAVIASIGLTPIETCRIRTVAEPNTYRDIGLLGTAKAITEENSSALYSGFPSLCTRQVIFGSIKFLAFEKSSEAIFFMFPELRDATITALEVSLAAGAFSGALSSFVSQPFDSVLTYIAKNTDGKNLGVLEGCFTMIDKEGIASLYRGLGSRSLWAALIISGQFFLYDIFRSLFGVSASDLSQIFQLDILDGINL